MLARLPLQFMLILEELSAVLLIVADGFCQKLIAVGVAVRILAEQGQLLKLLQLWNEGHHPVVV